MLYPNGSGSIYSTDLLLRLFSNFEGNIEMFASHIQPWDFEIGVRIKVAYGHDLLSHVGFITKSYSTFGDCILSFEERKALLLSGKISCVHQVKNDWTP